MTAREMLREVARDLDHLVAEGTSPRGWTVAKEQAAALRALADRIDAEMVKASWPSRAYVSPEACFVAAGVLRRLDSPTEEPPR